MSLSLWQIARQTRKGFVAEDHDTGDEIICFERRSKVYCFLRDIYTKRFIRKLEYIIIQYIGVFEACYPNGCRPGKGCNPNNNLHVECHKHEVIYPEDYEKIDEFEQDIDDLITKLVNSCEIDCFSDYGVSADREVIMLRTMEGYDECYMDRCENPPTI